MNISKLRKNGNFKTGDSIKPTNGNVLTLLRPGKATNFIFQLTDLKQETFSIDKFNEMKLFSDKFSMLRKNGVTIYFYSLQDQTFKNNLVMIDGLLPEILAEILFSFYSTKNILLSELLDVIEHKNPLNFDQQYNQRFYENKLKRFLSVVALGMDPSLVWSGQHTIIGIYTRINKDGELLCYPLSEWGRFENYLLQNTKF